MPNYIFLTKKSASTLPVSQYNQVSGLRTEMVRLYSCLSRLIPHPPMEQQQQQQQQSKQPPEPTQCYLSVPICGGNSFGRMIGTSGTGVGPCECKLGPGVYGRHPTVGSSTDSVSPHNTAASAGVKKQDMATGGIENVVFQERYKVEFVQAQTKDGLRNSNVLGTQQDLKSAKEVAFAPTSLTFCVHCSVLSKNNLKCLLSLKRNFVIRVFIK